MCLYIEINKFTVVQPIPGTSLICNINDTCCDVGCCPYPKVSCGHMIVKCVKRSSRLIISYQPS